MGDEGREPRSRGPNTKTSSATRAVLAAIGQCWPNSQFDQTDPAGVWANALTGLSKLQITHGIRALSAQTSAFPPSPGQFRALCVGFRASETDEPRRVRDMSARGIAWRACQAAYARRLTGMQLGQVLNTTFDVARVVEAAPVPKSSALVEHQHCWEALELRFNEAWGA